LISHLLDGHQVGVGRTERLDYRTDAALEEALGKAARFDRAWIENLRVAGDDGSASCWHRMCPAWCPACIRGDLACLGEVYERATWRLGCCVLCPRHGIPLDDTCRRCAAETPCHFRGVNGLLRLTCNACGRQVDPALYRNDGLDVEGARVFGVRLTPSLTWWIANLQSDALATFGGSFPHRSWGLVPSDNRLIDAMRELAVCIIVVTRTKFIPRIDLSEPQAGQVSPSYEPITPAALPMYAARGVLGIVAAMLANLEAGGKTRLGGRSDLTTAIMTVVSFVERLSADGRRLLQYWAATWGVSGRRGAASGDDRGGGLGVSVLTWFGSTPQPWALSAKMRARRIRGVPPGAADA
jgi:hypothetical protein